MNESSELFDVYVSYASADEEWVKRELLPRLEQERLRIALAACRREGIQCRQAPTLQDIRATNLDFCPTYWIKTQAK